MNIFKFEYPLPYWIPLEKNVYVESALDSILIKINILQERGTLIVNHNESHFPYSLFIIEFCDNLDVEYKFENVDDEAIGFFFEQGLIVINYIIDLLRSENDLLYLHNLVRSELPPIIPFTFNGTKTPYVTCIHRLIGENYRQVTFDKFREIWNNRITLSEDRIINYYRRHFDRAKSDFILGRHSDSIINLQTAFEVFIDSMIYQIELKKLTPKEEIEKLISKMAFRHKLEHYLTKALNRNLSFDKNPVIRKWKESIYNFRNAIVHEGFETNLYSARIALKVFIRVHNYLASINNKFQGENIFLPVEVGSVSLAEQKPLMDKLFKEKMPSAPYALSIKYRIFFKLIRIKATIDRFFHRIKVFFFLIVLRTKIISRDKMNL